VNAGQLAALIAAGFFAIGMCAAVFVLLRVAGLISHANRVLTDYGDRASTLIERAQAAVDQTQEQLARTDSITANMDEVTTNMAELTGHVSALTGLARAISDGLGVPLLRASGFVFGVRRAVALRRPGRAAATAAAEAGVLPYRQASVPGRREALPAGRDLAAAGRDLAAAGRDPAAAGPDVLPAGGRSGGRAVARPRTRRSAREEVRS
jgi:Bacterial protein of unknown function (DUF948)